MTDPIFEFEDFMVDHGLPCRNVVADGKLHRFKPVGDKSSTAHGWYVLHLDNLPAGSFGSWKTGEKHSWCLKPERKLSAEERKELERKKESDRKARELEDERVKAEAKAKAERLWNKVTRSPVNVLHPYLKAKGIKPNGIREMRQSLVVPVRNGNGELTSLQFIQPDGSKRFLTGGEIQGCYFTIGGRPTTRLLICEGYATGATLFEATGLPIVVAFNSGNLLPVAKAMRDKFPELEIVICSDNDHETTLPDGTRNPGVQAAAIAAREIGAFICIPPPAPGKTDFNDLGSEAGVREFVRYASRISDAEGYIDERTQPFEDFRFSGLKREEENGSASSPTEPPSYFEDIPPPEIELQADPNAWPKSVEEAIERSDPMTFFERTKSGLKPKPYVMADFLKASVHFVTEDSGDYIFNGGRYEDVTDRRFENLVIRLTGQMAKPSDIDNFKRISRGSNYHQNFFEGAEPGLMNMANGVLDIKSGEFYPHDPKYRMRYKLKVPYDSKALAPRWEEYLSDTFGGDADLILMVKEIMAYTLMGGEPFLQRAFCFYGTGRNGKSTLLNVLKNLIGRENFSTVPLKLLDKPFSVVTMEGKIANICEETPTDTINAEFFKAAVGGAELQAAQKNKPEYSMPVKARFIFACNELPTFKDSSKGMLDRLVFVPFKRYLTEDKRDTEIDKKLLAEMPGIINDLVPIARHLLTERRITKPAATQELKEVYKAESCSVYDWYRGNLEVCDDRDPINDTQEMYEAYVEKTEAQGRRPLSREGFVKRLIQYVKDDMADFGLNPELAESYQYRHESHRIRGVRYVKYQLYRQR